MKTLSFTIKINASADTVWKHLWELENYKKWTSVFCQGSYYKTDRFEEGHKIHLLTPNGDGMYSLLEKVVQNELLVFKHLGELHNFEEQPIQEWTNALESYQLHATENETELTVQVETAEEYVGHMNNTFPMALQELKRICEK